MRELDDRPEMFPHLTGVWEAFWLLSADREMGWSIGPIPLRSRYDYCDRHGFIGDDQEQFLFLIQVLDKEYLHWTAEKRKQAQAKA